MPLLSSHACALPGILSTRLIPDPKDRLATILVAPFMSCTARLPVYVLLISLLFAGRPWLAGAALLHSAIVTERRGALAGWTSSSPGSPMMPCALPTTQLNRWRASQKRVALLAAPRTTTAT